MVTLADVCARWRLAPGPALGHRPEGTWAVTRGGVPLVLKHFGAAAFPDWRYQLRVAAALRTLGWPTPEPAEEPLDGPDGAWVLFHRLPGRPRPASVAEQRSRGRLLAELHASAAATGITEQRGGFAEPAEVVGDPELEHWLRIHESARGSATGSAPGSARGEEGRLLRAARDATAQWFADRPAIDAPRSVIHSDFAPWNLLFDDDGRLSALLDFEGTHHTFQVSDFALSWRGYQDEVLIGYDEVRPLSDLEWELVGPAYRAWLFFGVKDALAAHYRDGGPEPDLQWQVAHLHKRSPLLLARASRGRRPTGGRGSSRGSGRCR